ncbi:MAG: CinA family nicotinamide mononucleotide deamidase-related protein [Gammaproteobacteria bacterium]|nr:CinA family nicotinamide mononucleotide deamidase-related protein [Gammaproteobacteria bacterium]
MRCEIVAIGTELLLGQITDTNSSWIGEQLALAGIDSYFQVKVGDNLERMIDCIQHALARSDAVITCGGLGPTQDDITREALARIMGVGVERDAAIATRIRHMFESRGREMSANNLLQADVPIGATPMAQMPGTAPGLVCPLGDKVIYAVPGVPSEMREMMQGTILPDLKRRAGVNSVIRSRVLRTWGHSESGLAEILAERLRELDRSKRATLAFQASGIEGIKVRITAKADSDTAVMLIIDEEEQQVRELLSTYIFGTDEQTMESVVLECLRLKGLSIAVAETVTGGLISTRLSATKNAREVFRGSVIVNDPETQERVLGVAGAIPSLELTAALAQAVRREFGADVGIASTGIDTSMPSADLRPGTVFLALSLGDECVTERIRLPGDPERVREYSVISLLNFLRRRLNLETLPDRSPS